MAFFRAKTSSPWPLALMLTLLVGGSSTLNADTPVLSDYLPDGVSYDPAVPAPRDVLGFEVGAWHVRHDQLVAYMRAVADASKRVELIETGKTYEGRQLVVLAISSPSNIERLEAVRQAHLAAASSEEPQGAPLVVQLGYSVHGNEASGSNASLVVAYYLAAARGDAIDTLLDETVVLLDPCLNPDGLARFAQWANMHRGMVLVDDPWHREHAEHFPSGRTNHYWFDLNRDWLLAQHPESHARLAHFHRWRPHVLTDHHEMGTNSTYFFQPGVPSRKHPLTPQRNVELTAAIAAHHAEAFDAQGRLYYTEETFDDFYYGKGSTYPDLHGAVGILFEQASARGHLQASVNGPVSFPFAIQNQITTSLSTLAGAQANREGLLDYRAEFTRRSHELAAADALAGVLVGDDGDGERTARMIDVLMRHQIEVRPLAADQEIGEHTWKAGQAWWIPHDQEQYRLVRALFERRTTFEDETFYDVSAWPLAHAFGLPFAELDRRAASRLSVGAAITARPAPAGTAPSDEAPAVAWAFAWEPYLAPRALGRLLGEGVLARVATEPFTARTAQGEVAFSRGTIVVPKGIQTLEHEAVLDVLTAAADEDGLTVRSLTGGLTPSGIDLGSPSLVPVDEPAIGLVVGRGVSMYQAGEMWHLLDQRFGLPVSLLDRGVLPFVNLDDYSHLILVGGQWDDAAPDWRATLRTWVQRGGVLLATSRAAVWAQGAVLAEPLPPGTEMVGRPDDVATDPTPYERRPYETRSADFAQTLVSGTVFSTDLDISHPLAYGYSRKELSVFRDTDLVLEPIHDPYGLVAQYTESPRVAGFVSDENLARIAGSPAITAERLGGGLVVRMIDNPNFRAYWHATHKLVLNTLFFGPIVQGGAPGR